MNDTMSEHMRISLTVWAAAALLAVVVTVATFCILVFNDYTGKYSDAMVSASTGTIYDLSREREVTCPQCYSAITASISIVDTVTFKSGGVESVLYKYKTAGSGDSLMTLMTGKTSTKSVRMTIEQSSSNPTMVNILLEEVDR